MAIINPNKNIRGKIVLKNLLLALVLKVANTEGETTAIKKIIEPIKIVLIDKDLSECSVIVLLKDETLSLITKLKLLLAIFRRIENQNIVV